MLKFGLIGLGYFGKHYMRLLQNMEGVRLVAVCSHSKENIKQFVLPDGVRKFTDYREMLKGRDLDAVVIAAPASLHLEMASFALENDKHVLVEKPMVTSLEDADTLEHAVKRSGKILMVGHQYVYNDVIRHLKRELEGGALGGIRYIFAEHFYRGPIRYDVNLLWETATHEVSIFDHLFGPDAIVSASGRAVSITGERNDFISFTAEFENGIIFSLAMSWYAPQKTRRMVIAGKKGMALFDESDSEKKLQFILHPYPEKEGKGQSSDFLQLSEKEVIVPSIEVHEPLRNELDHFIHCIGTGMQPLTGIEHGLRITRYLDKISKVI